MSAITLVHARGARSDRAALVDALVTALDARGVRWAFQGAVDAPDRWAAASGTADLDLWVASADLDLAAAVLAELGGARVVAAHDPRRLRHESWWFDMDGPAIVDLTVGDLRVGPLLLCAEAPVRVERIGGRPHLTGVAAAMDRLVRPLLRGRIPDADRLDQARGAWCGSDPAARTAATVTLVDELGRRLGGEVVDVLRGGRCADDLAIRARRRLGRRTVGPAALRAALAQRHTVLPTRRPGPVGVRTAGTLVVLCGTDGSGKSTVARALTESLESRGYRVRAAYFGMARGNLPGVALARRLLGVASPAADAADVAETATPVAGVDDVSGAPAHARLRALAAYYYALEYGWRYLTKVVPGLVAHDVVVCDRYVYDLRWSPSPGSPAERVGRLLTGRPDVLAVPDADPDVIFGRKPERSVDEIAAQQAGFRALVAERVAAHTNMTIDTSGATADPVAPLVRAVVEATHRRTLRGA